MCDSARPLSQVLRWWAHQIIRLWGDRLSTSSSQCRTSGPDAGLCWGRCRHCSGNYKAQRASGGKKEAWIAIFWTLAAAERFSRISRKVEIHWGKLESRWGKQKAVEESRKPLMKVGKPLRKIGFWARKIGFRARRISIFPKRFSSFWQFGGLVLLQDLLPRVCMDLLCWTQVLTTKIKSS